MTIDDIPACRRPLDAARVTETVVRPGGLWHEIAVTPRTGSTNADVAVRARAGAPDGVVLVAEEQTAGRGRLGRRWLSPPRAALTFSVLVRPRPVPPARRGWLPLLAGVAVASAVREVSGVDAGLKWPNDVLVGERKLAGILAEQSGDAGGPGDAVVVGIGINVSTHRDELPAAGPGTLPATSLLLEGWAGPDRERLLCRVLAEFERWYLPWRAAAGEPTGLRRAYLALCRSLGRDVRVELPDGRLLAGTAVHVDQDGRLVVRVGSSDSVAVAAGDVVHVR